MAELDSSDSKCCGDARDAKDAECHEYGFIEVLDGEDRESSTSEPNPEESTSHMNQYDPDEEGSILKLSWMKLTELPKVAILPFKALRNVDLSYNQIEEIPDYFIEPLVNVEYFNVSFNNLKTLPELFGARMKRLKYLNISENDLKTLPLTLWQCSDLEYLNCLNNPLSENISAVVGPSMNSLQCFEGAKNLLYYFSQLNYFLNLSEDQFENITTKLRSSAQGGKNLKAQIWCELTREFLAHFAYEEPDWSSPLNKFEQEKIHRKLVGIAKKEVILFQDSEANKWSFQSLLNQLLMEETDDELETPRQFEREGHFMAQGDIGNAGNYEMTSDGNNNVIDVSTDCEDATLNRWRADSIHVFLKAIFWSIAGFSWCYYLIWPILAAMITSEDGLELACRDYLSYIIPFDWTEEFRGFHKGTLEGLQVWSQVFTTEKIFPFIDYQFPRSFWLYLEMTINWVKGIFMGKPTRYQ